MNMPGIQKIPSWRGDGHYQVRQLQNSENEANIAHFMRGEIPEKRILQSPEVLLFLLLKIGHDLLCHRLEIGRRFRVV